MLGTLIAAALSVSSLPSFTACELDKQHSELAGSECIYAKLPLNYHQTGDKATNSTVSVFVRKFPTQGKPKGTLWLLAGGPGESGASFYNKIDWFAAQFPGFDIYVQDHRGTGASSAICPQETIESEQGVTIAPNEWGPCFGHIFQNPDYVKSFSISNAAEDLTQLIDHYGTGKTYVYSVSYGTQLATRLMSLNKVKLDGVILDSFVPHQLDKRFDLSNRSQVVNQVGLKALAKFSDEPHKIEQKILAFQKQYPLLSDLNNALPQIALSQYLGLLLDHETIRAKIPYIVDQLATGNSAPLQAAGSDFQDWLSNMSGSYSNEGMSIMLVQLITKSENNLRLDRTKEQALKEQQSLAFSSPLPYLIAQNQIPAYEKDKWYGHVPDSDVPVLILQGTLDPKTQYEGAQAHAALFEGKVKPKLVAIDGAPHAILNTTQRDIAAAEIKAFLKDK
ncbi:alpha/beta hydrolase [Pseudoalteromonas sp. T1lg65]|uniref:alpha/beta hydrolase n=1 Tax=Pseudoalteromonas sp. T1lg65 TaxID=2077101 RepID=UPI003F78EE96